MKNSRMVKVLLVAALLPGCALLRCMNPNSGGTETGDAKVSGVLYNSGGSRSAGAKVACIPRHYNPNGGSRTGIDSTVTDDTGSYRFKTMPADTYNIFAQSDSGLVYIESVVIKPDSQSRIPPDTLKAPGSIRGRIELEPGDDARNVFIIFLGTYVFRMADDSVGNFAITDLAKGRYRVRILTTLPNYRVMDTAFTITAGRDSVLPQPIRLEYTGIPVPKGLRIVYDTLKQIVTLIWNKPTTGRMVQSYTIYRKRSDSASFVNIKGGVTDTTYNDSTGVQDQTYEYRVAVVDTFTTEGTKSAGVSATFIKAVILIDSIPLEDRNAYDLTFDMNGNIWVVCSDAQVYKLDSNGTKIAQWGQQGTGIGQLNEPMWIGADNYNNLYVGERGNARIQKFDTAGNSIWIIQYYDTINPPPFLPSLPVAVFNDTVFVTFQEHAVKRYLLTGDSIGEWSFPSYSLNNLVRASGDTICTNNIGTNEILLLSGESVVSQWQPSQMTGGGLLDVALNSKGNYITAHSMRADGDIDIYIYNPIRQLIALFHANLYLERMVYHAGKLYLLSNSDLLIYALRW